MLISGLYQFCNINKCTHILIIVIENVLFTPMKYTFTYRILTSKIFNMVMYKFKKSPSITYQIYFINILLLLHVIHFW